MVKAAEPARPESVPPDARWVPDDREWEQGRGTGSARNGPFTYWRPDGTRVNECVLKNGVPHGPFKRYHENGALSQEGQFVEGELHGLRVWHGCDGPSTEARLADGMAETVWKSEMEYELGRVLAVRHFDRAGKRVNPDGTPYPVTPRGVPEKAEYHPDDDRWVEVTLDKQGERHGRVRTWTAGGEKLEEADWEHGQRHGTARLFGAQGRVREEGRFRHSERTGVFRFYTDEGLVAAEREYHHDALHGHVEEYAPSGEIELEETYVRGARDGVFRLHTHFKNPAVAEVQGTWRKGVPESPWTLMGHDGVPLRLLDMESQDGGLLTSEVFSDPPRPAEAWLALAETLLAAGRRNEAIVAAARSAAGAGKVAGLFALLDRVALPLEGDRAQALFDELAEDGGPGALLDALRVGAAPAAVFQRLAVLLDQKLYSRAALDLINAALLVDPDRTGCHFTRSLVLMSLGLSDQATLEAHALASAEPDQSEFLLDYVRVLFPVFGFWPASVKPETTYDGLPERPARKLDEVKATIGKYAARLKRTRAALLTHVRPDVPWMLPDLGKLVPKGGGSLGQFTIERTVEGESEAAGPIEVDEEQGLDDGAELPALLRLARADWAALCWLCWAVGLDAVAQPKKLKARPEFPTVAGMSAQRLWRCRDRRLTGGRVAKDQGTPGFEWEGLSIDALAPALVSMPEAEWAEVQAVMKWLAYEDAFSPWQDDLRGS